MRVARQTFLHIAAMCMLAAAIPASASDWPSYLGHWQTASKPAYQDMFHVELQVVQLQTGYSMTWVQEFAAHPRRELRHATLKKEAANRWQYAAKAATGRSRHGAAWFEGGSLRFEYREHDPSGHSARILEMFTHVAQERMESSRMIWREGGWQPLTAESWWRVRGD